MRRRTVVAFGLLSVPILLLAAAGAVAIWRIPFAEAAIAGYVERTYGVPVTIAISELSTSSARIDHVKLGERAPFEASDIRLDYDLKGNLSSVAVGKASAHGRIEGGAVTLGDLEPLVRSGGDQGAQTGGGATLPQAISVDRLDLALGTPMGDVAIGGSARLGQGALALDLTANDGGGHTRATAKIDVSSALAEPTMTGDVRISLAPQSPLWGVCTADRAAGRHGSKPACISTMSPRASSRRWTASRWRSRCSSMASARRSWQRRCPAR
jgi:hypothetical protein